MSIRVLREFCVVIKRISRIDAFVIFIVVIRIYGISTLSSKLLWLTEKQEVYALMVIFCEIYGLVLI